MLGVVRGPSIAVVYPQDVAGLQHLFFFFFQVFGRLCQLPLGENEGVRGGWVGEHCRPQASFIGRTWFLSYLSPLSEACTVFSYSAISTAIAALLSVQR